MVSLGDRQGELAAVGVRLQRLCRRAVWAEWRVPCRRFRSWFKLALSNSMETSRLAELLQPFLEGPGSAEPRSLSDIQLRHISMHIDILLRWNARMNLTAVRRPEDIVTRHFGESLFAATHLFPGGEERAGEPEGTGSLIRVFDVGSGAGFPGLPIRIWAPDIALTLIESNHKKVTFLREVVRALALAKVSVFGGRAEELAKSGADADVVTLRAVERFESALQVAASLVRSGGRLALLIGRGQVDEAGKLDPSLEWNSPTNVPLSDARVLLIGRKVATVG